ncbi:unnamed protein product [Mytilus coruscus]|uniref:Uncharacterized protein n=1 Tax=Mytilus coruscus TaxID=42192 RepID=A0A6J8BSK5_MYTCO|nr:unnamed protein product [Mytilus coruscus]
MSQMAGLEHVVVGLDFNNIDLCMDKVLRDYPVNIFPTSLNKRTGKAKKCLYEEIDVNLYEKEARMVTFCTSLAHIHPWIKTLDLFYYEHMGINEQFDIKRCDVPTTWSDPNNNGNSIVIEIFDQVLQFNTTFFVTTGTIRVQGSKYMTFVQSHFPVLMQILAKLLNSCNTLVDENQNDLDQTILNLKENLSSNLDLQSDCVNDNHDDSLTSIKSIVEQDEHTSTLHTAENPSIVDHFSRIEKTITNAIMQVENQQTNDHSKLMTAINYSCETLSTLIKANPRSKDQSEVTSL